MDRENAFVGRSSLDKLVWICCPDLDTTNALGEKLSTPGALRHRQRICRNRIYLGLGKSHPSIAAYLIKCMHDFAKPLSYRVVTRLVASRDVYDLIEEIRHILGPARVVWQRVLDNFGVEEF